MFNSAYAPFGNVVRDFVNPSISPKPRDINRNNNDATNMTVRFTIPADATLPVTVTFIAPNLTLQTNNNLRTPGLTITTGGGNNAADRTYSMTVNTAGDYYFTVRNLEDRQYNTGEMRLQAPFFNSTNNLNAQ